MAVIDKVPRANFSDVVVIVVACKSTHKPKALAHIYYPCAHVGLSYVCALETHEHRGAENVPLAARGRLAALVILSHTCARARAQVLFVYARACVSGVHVRVHN